MRFLILTFAFFSTATAVAQTVEYTDQGNAWTSELRAAFYQTDQGSRIMPLAWMKALKLEDERFLLDGALVRYGYIADDTPTAPPTLPIGFTVSKDSSGLEMVGMTCAACHTRQISVGDRILRIDGGPALVDFQALLQDIDQAVERIRKNDASFVEFADAVLGVDHTALARANLRVEIDMWGLRFHSLIEGSMPDEPWGVGRLDAISMIFNRLAGLDLGPSNNARLLLHNIFKADAPARYPFLWNAARQEKTQWLGFAENRTENQRLGRNLGQVYGVFGEFRPRKTSGVLYNRDFLAENSANFPELTALEDWIAKISPPKWPFDLPQLSIIEEGKAIFENVGCKGCHGSSDSTDSFWKTKIVDVGTDTRQCELLEREVDTGVMEGARVLSLSSLGPREKPLALLEKAVEGTITQLVVEGRGSAVEVTPSSAHSKPSADTPLNQLPTSIRRELLSIQETIDVSTNAPTSEADQETSVSPSSSIRGCRYEARVLDGIWAAAPYLHNGSIRSLRDLLSPVTRPPNAPTDRPYRLRASSFEVGPAYDPEDAGLAADQPGFHSVMATTADCDGPRNSGNSRCGHEFGIDLSNEQKEKLISYLKSL